jgi:hypothetical protein
MQFDQYHIIERRQSHSSCTADQSAPGQIAIDVMSKMAYRAGATEKPRAGL